MVHLSTSTMKFYGLISCIHYTKLYVLFEEWFSVNKNYIYEMMNINKLNLQKCA